MVVPTDKFVIEQLKKEAEYLNLPKLKQIVSQTQKPTLSMDDLLARIEVKCGYCSQTKTKRSNYEHFCNSCLRTTKLSLKN